MQFRNFLEHTLETDATIVHCTHVFAIDSAWCHCDHHYQHVRIKSLGRYSVHGDQIHVYHHHLLVSPITFPFLLISHSKNRVKGAGTPPRHHVTARRGGARVGLGRLRGGGPTPIPCHRGEHTYLHHATGSGATQPASAQGGWAGVRGNRPTCSMRSTCRVMLTAIPKSTSLSKDGSLVMELALTMLLRRALLRVKPSNPAGLLGRSKPVPPPPLLLLAGAGTLIALPCTSKCVLSSV